MRVVEYAAPTRRGQCLVAGAVAARGVKVLTPVGLQRFEAGFRAYEAALGVMDRSERCHQRNRRYMRNRSMKGEAVERLSALSS